MGDQAANVHTLYEHVVRAGEFAQRIPMGPVYLNAPLEVMLQEWTPRDNPRRIPPPPKTRAKDADVEKIAEQLITARNPVILSDSAGRDPAAFTALVDLADLFGIPVGGRAAFANFPKNHPLHLGTGIQPLLKDADLVLLVACRAPWYPPSHKPTSGSESTTASWPRSARPRPTRRVAIRSIRWHWSARCAKRCRRTRSMSRKRSPTPACCSSICLGPRRRAFSAPAAGSGKGSAPHSASSSAHRSGRSPH